MMFLQALLLLISTLALTSAEIIQLENKDNIYCITDNLQGLLHLSPPVIEKGKDSSVLLESDTEWDGWSLVNSKEVVVPFVKDKRWEDFETQYLDSVHYDSVRSLSYSFFASGVNVITDNPANTRSDKATRDVSLSWGFGSTYPKNKTGSFQIDVQSQNKTYWKIHDYNLRWTDTVSDSPTVINVTATDLSCVDVYVYLCTDCVLTVIVDSNLFNVYGVDEKAWEWQHQSFKVATGSKITIARALDKGDVGEWAVDIRRCPITTTTNKIVYHPDLSKDVQPTLARSCQIYGILDKDQNAFNCSLGVLGKNCDIKCQDLLGDDKQSCEEYKICAGSVPVCSCAWGYEGESCDQACSGGKWGLSCLKNCPQCDTCNAKTGECTGSAASNIAVATLVIGALAAIFL